eukprot:symbB.v1.2.015188.t1/scaffold1044.1/size142232/9
MVSATDRCNDLEERCEVLMAKKTRMEQRKKALEQEVCRNETLKLETEAKAALEEEQWTTDQRPSLEAAVERLKRHRDAWQELCRELRRTVVQHEHELKELQEENDTKLIERHRLQSECLQLQQECEDARSKLSDVRNRVEESASTVEKMVSQQLTLERTMEEGSQQHARMQCILQHSLQSLATDLAEKTQVAEVMHEGSKEHLFGHKKHLLLQKNQVAQLHADFSNLEDQCDAFENALSCAIAETEALEHKVREAKRGAVIENQKEAFARQRLEAVRGGKGTLHRRHLELQRLCKNIEDESAKLQEEHARLLLGRARRKAVTASIRSRSHEPRATSPQVSVASPAGSLELALCRGYFGPAGAPVQPGSVTSPMARRDVRRTHFAQP